MQRAGTVHITPVDRDEAIRVSAHAVKAALSGQSGKMVTINRGVTKAGKYTSRCGLKATSKVANEEKMLPKEFRDDIHYGSGQLMRDYLEPLIAGDLKLKSVGGVTSYAKLKKVRIQ